MYPLVPKAKLPANKVGSLLAAAVLCTAFCLIPLALLAPVLRVEITVNKYDPSASAQRDAPVAQHHAAAWDNDLPTLLIYRRSIKTGSSSLVTELLRTLTPLNYTVVHRRDQDIVRTILRGNYHRHSPKRYMVLMHNAITRDVAPPWARTVIIDTVRDGYEHITSFCRYRKRVATCGQELADCLLEKDVLQMSRFRWAGRPVEDAATYIDIPVMAAYPALATTLLRRVFPGITFNIKHFRAAGAHCERNNSKLVQIYNENYQQLEEQVIRLRGRMLTLAGYPDGKDPTKMGNVTWDRILEAAESIEKAKYAELQSTPVEPVLKVPQQMEDLDNQFQHWTLGNDGKIVVGRRGWED